MSNFAQITTFIEVANSQSFAEASRRLSLPTSTVSARIKALENRLDVRLFNRSTRQVTLTDEGDLYLNHCQETLDRLLDIEDRLTQKNHLSGRIKITIPLDLPSESFAKVMIEFSRLYPRVTIDILVTDEPLDLISNNIDLALRGGSLKTLSLISRKLGEGKLNFFASPRYCQQKTDKKRSTSLHKHVLFDPMNNAPSLALQYIKGSINTRNFALAKQFAEQSQGIALLPESLCTAELSNGSLEVINVDVELPVLPLYIVFPSRDNLPKRVRTFIDFLLSTTHTLI
ncbi:LysR family transcriptional regulator [Thalassotalea hakodatensis]|uniref:LysR family transcriptional regulator n=1 Tax=Thalassotalea hakodatensis TaxID=3030492 RepID=UPI0025738067|nr:LysR family transcriptional regulator [Thalassotalea hakodatensis]